MTIAQAMILGFVQGVTEFLPISSSGHLLILPKLFAWPEQGIDFDVAVHVATLGAILIALRQDVLKMIRAPRLLALIALGTVPIVVFGMILPDELLNAARAPLPVAVSLIVWGVALVVADWIAKHHEKLPSLTRITWWQSFAMGCAQMIALIPGTSRSGITMTTGMIIGLSREDSARYAFLLAIPAIVGAGLLTFKDVLVHGLTTPIAPMAVGAVAAFVSGLFAIKLLMVVARKASFMWFGLYRIVLAVIILMILV